jgi:hypothetical protein
LFEKSVHFEVQGLEQFVFSLSVEGVGGVIEGPEVRVPENVGRSRGLISVAAGRIALLQIPFARVIEFVVIPDTSNTKVTV